MIRITYIFHDCFLLETPLFNMVFDYWREENTAHADGLDTGKIPEFLRRLDVEKELYVVVSHHHKDHFTRDIFSWEQTFSKVKYIISRDTEKMIRHMLRPDSLYSGYRPRRENVIVLRPGEMYEDSLLCVNAFGSTDIGNSYLVTSEGRRYFHAGDLNAWVWIEESTRAEIEAALKEFLEKLAPLEAMAPKIDYAMFPVDARMGKEYWTGAKLFVRRIDVGHFFPMHFALSETEEQGREFRRKAALFDEYANPERGAYIALLSPGCAYQNV